MSIPEEILQIMQVIDEEEGNEKERYFNQEEAYDEKVEEVDDEVF